MSVINKESKEDKNKKIDWDEETEEEFLKLVIAMKCIFHMNIINGKSLIMSYLCKM